MLIHVIILLKYDERRENMDNTDYNRPNLAVYRTAQVISLFLSAFVFKRKILRNEIKDAEGPFVVVANHQAAYDFANLIGATKRRMSFVISNAFYNSLPITNILKSLGVIPKQQFQTSVSDMKRIKAVVDSGEPLVIYPAGLMCEDGLSTPIPQATYKFLKWLGVDVYVARTSGTYFAMPKWSKGFRAGRTYMDIYKLFSKEELKKLPVSEIKKKTDEALLFDAYREQDELRVKYADNDNLEGLETVLYMCPHCGSEFTMEVKDRSTIYCTSCGYEEHSDEFALLHNHKGIGRELRYVSDWSKLIFNKLKQRLEAEKDFSISAGTRIKMLDYDKHKFKEVGFGIVSLCKDNFSLRGIINGEHIDLKIPSVNIPTLPFTPGKYLELQNGDDIYRCVLHDGKLVMKFINVLKAFYEINNPEKIKK